MVPILSEVGVLLSDSVPATEGLVLVVVVGILLVGVPTIGIYRESSTQSDHPYSWTGGMFLLSVLAPVIGPVVLWILYTRAEVRS